MNALIEKPGDGLAPALWLKVLASVLAAAAISGFGAGLSAWVDLQRLRDRFDHCRYDIERIEDVLFRLEANSTTNTINRLRNEVTIEKLEQQVQALQTIPTSRPDKFTGTDAKEMEDRFDKRLKALESKP